jgi:WD40 repeat protein
VAFLTDERVVIGDKSGVVRALDLADYKEIWQRGLGAEVRSISFVQTRNQIAAGLANGAVIWLEPGTGNVVAKTDLGFPILSLRTDAGGRLLAIGMEKPGGLVVLDSDNQRVLDMQHSHAGSVQGSAFNQPGDTVYWGGSGSYVWACVLKSSCQRVTQVEDWLYFLDGSADRRYTAYAAGNKIEFFDHANQKQQTLGEAGGHVFALRFDPSGQYLATAGSDHSISIYDVRAQRLLFKAPSAHDGYIYDLEFAPRGDRLVAVGLDGQLTVWKVIVMGGPVPPHFFQPAEGMLASRQRNRISEIRIVRENAALVRTWDQRDRILRIDPVAEEGSIPQGSVFQDRLAESLDLAKVSAFRLTQFSPVALWTGGSEEVPAIVKEAKNFGDPDKQIVALSRDRKLLGIVASNGRAHVFIKGETGSSRVFETGGSAASAAAFVPATDLLLLGYEGGQIHGFSTRSGTEVFEAKCEHSPIQFLIGDQSGPNFIAASRRGPLCLFDASGSLVAQSPRLVTDALALAPDGSLVAAAGLEGEIVLMSALDLSELARFRGHRGSVDAVHFTLDSKNLVSGGADETLRVWPAKEAQIIMTVPIAELRRDYPSPEPAAGGVEAPVLLRQLWRQFTDRLITALNPVSSKAGAAGITITGNAMPQRTY